MILSAGDVNAVGSGISARALATLLAATSWCMGSRKSGPHLKGWTTSPRSRSAAMSPQATVVFPTPDDVPATTMTGTDAMSMLAATGTDVRGEPDTVPVSFAIAGGLGRVKRRGISALSGSRILRAALRAVRCVGTSLSKL